MFLLPLVGAVCALGAWLYWHYTRLARAGFKHGPIVPLLGDMAGVMMQKEHYSDVLMRIYQSFPGYSIVGRYEFLTPYLVVKDLELLKKITIKDFEYFVDRNFLADIKAEPIINRSLLCLKGDEWKKMRSTLSPAFTSAKIRLMVPSMQRIAEQMAQTLEVKIKQSKVDYIDLEALDLTSRYVIDVIATCIFGLDVNSQNGDNDFYKMTKKLITRNFVRKLKINCYIAMPTLMTWLNVTVFPSRVKDYFYNLVLAVMKNNDEMDFYRRDLIGLIAEAKDGYTEMDLVAQAVIFLFAGLDTSMNTLSYLLYELAVNPECQERLMQEIRETEKRNNGKFDYNSVQHMTYLDMVVSELLRKWPIFPAMNRRCVRDYNLGKLNDKSTEDVIIRKGETVQIPFWGILRDPKYFPNPEKFDPERFSEANKDNINPIANTPFGLGPRNCIGSRFALAEIKVMTYQLLLHVEVMPCEKTNIPLQLCRKDGFRMVAKGGKWLRFKLRK